MIVMDFEGLKDKTVKFCDLKVGSIFAVAPFDCVDHEILMKLDDDHLNYVCLLSGHTFYIAPDTLCVEFSATFSLFPKSNI